MRRLRALRRRRRGDDPHAAPDSSAPLEAAADGEDFDAGYAPVDDRDAEFDTEPDDEREYQPFVPVERRQPDPYAPPAADEVRDEVADDDAPPRRRRLRLPRPRLPRVRLGRPRLPALNVRVRWDILLLVVVLFGGGVFGTLLRQGDVSDDVETWWPLAILAGALVWMVVALARRRVAAFLGAWAVVGLGLSLLMDAQDIAALEETLMGVMLVTVGLGIAIRGLLLRGQPGA